MSVICILSFVPLVSSTKTCANDDTKFGSAAKLLSNCGQFKKYKGDSGACEKAGDCTAEECCTACAVGEVTDDDGEGCVACTTLDQTKCNARTDGCYWDTTCKARVACDKGAACAKPKVFDAKKFCAKDTCADTDKTCCVECKTLTVQAECEAAVADTDKLCKWDADATVKCSDDSAAGLVSFLLVFVSSF